MNWVAIDFGTSYSSATVMVAGKPMKVHPVGGLYDMYGFPTVAYASPEGGIMVCNQALQWRCHDPERFIKDFKLNIHESEISFLGVEYVDVIAAILAKIRHSASYALGNSPIEGAVLTIPAIYSDQDPRKAVMEAAARKAGFKEVEFVREADAAAIYFNHLQQEPAGTLTLIYDLGGGTFDPALVSSDGRGGCRLLGCASGVKCGGKYFEAALYRHLRQTNPGLPFAADENLRLQQVDALARVCKEVKEALSTVPEVAVPVPLMGQTVLRVSRPEFEALIAPLLEQTHQECQALLQSAGKTWGDLHRVLLIGGSCAIPAVAASLRHYMEGQNASHVPVTFNVTESGVAVDMLFAVSIGALLDHYGRHKAQPPEPPQEPSPLARAMSLGSDFLAHRGDQALIEAFMADMGMKITTALDADDNGRLFFHDTLQPLLTGGHADEAPRVLALLALLQEDFEQSAPDEFATLLANPQYVALTFAELAQKGAAS